MFLNKLWILSPRGCKSVLPTNSDNSGNVLAMIICNEISINKQHHQHNNIDIVWTALRIICIYIYIYTHTNQNFSSCFQSHPNFPRVWRFLIYLNLYIYIKTAQLTIKKRRRCPRYCHRLFDQLRCRGLRQESVARLRLRAQMYQNPRIPKVDINVLL